VQLIRAGPGVSGRSGEARSDRFTLAGWLGQDRTRPRPTLFEHQEICRTDDLEALVRQANAMAGCRSFDDVVRAFRAMRTLGGVSLRR
jgi:hypothetical protein